MSCIFLEVSMDMIKLKFILSISDLGLGTISALESLYNVTVYPTTVIDGQFLLDFMEKMKLIVI